MSLLRNSSNRKIALIGNSIIMTILLSVGSYSIYLQSDHVKLISHFQTDHIGNLQFINQMEHKNFQITQLINHLLNAHDQRMHDGIFRQLKTQIDDISSHISSYKELVNFHNNDVIILSNDYIAMLKEAEKSLANHLTEADAFQEEIKNIKQQNAILATGFSSIVNQVKKDMDQDYVKIIDQNESLFNSLFIAFALAFITGTIITFYALRSIRKKEELLIQEQKKVKQLFDHSSLPIYISDYDGNIVMTNDMGVKHLGYTRKELMKKKVWELDNGHLTLQECRAFWDQLQPGEQITVEGQHKTKDGKIKDVELNFAIITEDDSTNKLVMVFAKDITGKKLFNQKLKEEEERVKLALEGTNAALWDWRIDTNEITVDERWASLIGYDLSEISPITVQTWYQYTHPDDLQTANKRMEAHFTGETDHYEIRIRMRHKNGHWVWIWDRGKVTEYNEFGKPLRITGTHTDISDLVQAEEALKSSESKYKFISESLPHLLWILDSNFNLEYINNIGASTLGLDTASTKPEDWGRLVHPDDYEEIVALFNESIQSKSQLEHVHRLLTVDDRYKWFKVILQPKFNKKGEISHWFGLGIDINTEKEAERKIQESEIKFKALVSAFNDRIFTADKEFRITGNYGKSFQSKTFLNTEILGLKPHEYMSKEVGVLLEEKMKKALESNREVLEWKDTDNNGHTVYFQTSLSRISENEEITGLLGVTRDITARKKYELDLESEKEKLMRLTELGYGLALFNTREEIESYLVQEIVEQLGANTYALFSHYDETDNSFTVTEHEGDQKVLKIFNEAFGADFGALKIKYPQEMLSEIKRGELISYSLNDLNSLGLQPKNIDLEEISRYQINVIGLTMADKIIGMLSTFVHESIPVDEGYIIAFVQLASAVLEKIITLNSLKESEHNLELSKSKYQTLINSAPIILYEYTYDDRGLFYSDYIHEMLGYSAEELLKNPKIWKARVHPEDVHLIIEANNLGKNHKPFDIEYRIQHRNGEWKWFRDISINHSSNDTFIRGMVFDISREKELALRIDSQMNELKEKELKLRIAVQSAKQGIIDWDIENGEVSWNREMADVLASQYLTDKNLINTIERIVVPQYKEKTLDVLNVFAKGDLPENQVINHINRIKTKQGEKWLQISGMLVEKSQDGTGKRMIASVMDITDIKQAQTLLEENNRQLQLIIENIPAVIFNCFNDDQYTMTFISEYVEKVTGYKPDDFINNKTLSYMDIIHPDDIRPLNSIITRAFENNERYSVTYRIYNKAGEIRWLSETGEFQSHKEPADQNKINGIIFDITNNILAEEQKLAAIINSTDAERTRLAREIHDNIQQTMVSAYFNFESLKKEIDHLSEKQQGRLKLGLESLNQSIEDTRTLARNLMPKQIEDFGLVDSLEHLISNLDKNIKFDFYYNKKERFNRNIELNLYRITQEALNNAIKHSKAKEVFIQLLSYEHSITLTIEDDGVGFDPNKTDIVHNGFGMYSMKSRAMNIGARIDISSSPNGGTYIIVETPITN